MADVTLWVGGYPATEIAAHTPPTWETVADGGTGSISWAFALTPRSQHPALRPGSLVEVKAAAGVVARGSLVDPDRTTWECVAVGIHADRYLALDGAGNATRNLGDAIGQASARGWRVRNSHAVGVGYTVPGTSSDVQTIQSLLDEAAASSGARWRILPDSRVHMAADPTTPTYVVAPDAVVFGTTDETAVTHIVGRYDTGAGYATTVRPSLATAAGNRVEETLDLTSRGTLTLSQANTIIDGVLADRGKVGFVNGVTLNREQIMTPGGTPVFLPRVRAGAMARAQGLVAAQASVQAPWLDFIIGKTRHTAGEDTIYVEPANTAPRNLVDVIAAS